MSDLFYKYSQNEVSETEKTIRKSRVLKNKLLLSDEEKNLPAATLLDDVKKFSDQRLAFYFSQFSKEQLTHKDVYGDMIAQRFRREYTKIRLKNMSKEEIVGLYVNMALERDCKGVENKDFVHNDQEGEDGEGEGEEKEEDEEEEVEENGGDVRDKGRGTKKRETLDVTDRDELLDPIQQAEFHEAQAASLRLAAGARKLVSNDAIMQVTQEHAIGKMVSEIAMPVDMVQDHVLQKYLRTENSAGELYHRKRWNDLREDLRRTFTLALRGSWPEDTIQQVIRPITKEVQKMYTQANYGMNGVKMVEREKTPWMIEVDEKIAAQSKLNKQVEKAKSNLSGQPKKKQKFGGGSSSNNNNNRGARNNGRNNNGYRQQSNNNAGGSGNGAACPNCDRVNPTHTPDKCYAVTNPGYAAKVQANRAEGKPGFSYRQ